MTVHDPYAVTPRKPLTSKQRMELFLAHNGLCCVCGVKIKVGERWIDEHVDPLWRDGTNDLANRGPAHEKCARVKTDKETTERAKGRRIAEKHFGAHQSRSPMPCGRRSKFKKKMDGTIVLRDAD